MRNLSEQQPELGQVVSSLAEQTVNRVKNLGDRMHKIRVDLSRLSQVGADAVIIIQPEIDFSPPGDGVGKLLTNLFLFDHIDSHSLIRIVHSGSDATSTPGPHVATEEQIKVEILQEDVLDRSISVKFKADSITVYASMSDETDATGKGRKDEINTAKLVQETKLWNLILAETMVSLAYTLELNELERMQHSYFPEPASETET